MKLQLFFFYCLPLALAAQEVKPIVSTDYLALIKKDSIKTKHQIFVDASNDVGKSALHYQGTSFYQNMQVKNIVKSRDNTVVLQPADAQILYITGTAFSSVEMQHINQLPALQHQYVQGESVNGKTTWKGPETNEMFSYGPALNSLEFDGSNYPYDLNGKLVATGTGNGIKAKDYNNSIFKTAVLFTNLISLKAKYQQDYQHSINANFSVGQSTGNTFIIYNKNKTNNISASLEGIIKKFTVNGNYLFQQQSFSNNNRGGFLNQVYQNAMLTPISFENNQGNFIGATQRSYSKQADNPLFLLEDNGHSFLQQQHNASLSLEQKLNYFKIKLIQSYERKLQQSNEGYQPSTALFQNGILINRTASYANYFFNLNAQYLFYLNNYNFSATVSTNYIFKNNSSSINYLNRSNYHYQRNSHDASIIFSPIFRKYYFETGINFINKIYASNTATQSNFFLPFISAFVALPNLFRKANLKFSAAYNKFNSELPINQSFSQTNLLQYAVGNALQYLPTTEIESFNYLSPIEHKEFTAGLELNYLAKFTFSANWFSRQTFNDVFAINNNVGQIQLQNMANYRSQGIELEMSYKINKREFNFSNSASIVSYKTNVTDVKNGLDFIPIAGFSNVHKAIVKGQPMGVIVGNTYLRDANKNVIIGTDGFPLVNNALSVIGDPTPDFVIKINHHFNYKKWDLNIDWEWKKGGDIWNGTQSLLDYYGKSATSADLRNTTNYVFAGVQANGSHNSTPVSFYDPSLPISKNRWVRYGPSGVAETYIQKADCIRLNNVGISYSFGSKNNYQQQLVLTLFAHNIIAWSAYKGADANQLLNDQTNGAGLDFFNLPSYRSLGFAASLKF